MLKGKWFIRLQFETGMGNVEENRARLTGRQFGQVGPSHVLWVSFLVFFDSCNDVAGFTM